MEPQDQSRVKVIFVTTDPMRDTPEVLRAWLNNFDKRFIGLRGSLDSVNTIQSEFGLAPASMEEMDHSMHAGAANYAVGHAAQVLGFSADDSLRTMYLSGFGVSEWVNDLPKLARIR
jgi:protein SCO1/2